MEMPSAYPRSLFQTNGFAENPLAISQHSEIWIKSVVLRFFFRVIPPRNR